MHARLTALFVAVTLSLATARGSAAGAGPEFAVTAPDETLAPAQRGYLSLASDGDGFLATWLDYRSDAASYAARISADGVVIDRLGIRLPIVVRELSWNGEAYFGWEGAYVVRLRRDGTLIDATPRRVNPDGAVGFGFAAGRDHAISVHRDARGQFAATVFDSDLNVLHEAIPLVPDPPVRYFNELGTAVMPDGNFLVLLGPASFDCGSDCSIYAVQVSPVTGDVVRRSTLAPVSVASGEASAALAVGSSGFMLASMNYGSRTVTARSWKFDGTPVATHVLADVPATGGGYQPEISRDGSGYVVIVRTWRDGAASTRVARITESGQLDGGIRSVFISGDSNRDLLKHAWNGRNWLFGVGRYLVPGNETNFEVGVSAAWDRVDAVTPLSYSRTPQEAIALASNGSVHLALWSAGAASRGWELRATRVGPAGPIEPQGIEVGRGLQSWDLDEGIHASLATADGGFLVAWRDGPSLFARRLSSEGTWIDASPKLVAGDACSLSRQALARVEGGHVIAYTTCDPQQVVLRTLSGGDLTVGPTRALTPETNDVRNPIVARGEGGLLVVWQYVEFFQCPILCPTPTPAFVARMTAPDGEPRGDAFALTTEYGGGPLSPAVVWTGASYFVAWGTIGLRVAPDGTLLDPLDGELLLEEPAAAQPAVAFDGRNVQLLWSEDPYDATEERLRVLSVDPARSLSDQRATASADTIETGLLRRYRMPPGAIAAVSPDRFVLFYSRIAPDPSASGVSRVFMRSLGTAVRTRGVRR